MAQEQKKVHHPEKTKEEEVKTNPKIAEKRNKLIKDADNLLDKIDSILEENAEEFVDNYIQKGGE